jgi:hypothetical protein
MSASRAGVLLYKGSASNLSGTASLHADLLRTASERSIHIGGMRS